MDNNELVEHVRELRTLAVCYGVSLAAKVATKAELEEERIELEEVQKSLSDAVAQLQAELADTKEEMAATEAQYLDLFQKHRKTQAELDAVRGEREWRPIESAPKDGTKILAWMVDRAEIRKGFPPAELDGPDVIYWTSVGDGWVSHRFGTPTGWMPPPASPQLAL